MKLRDVKVLAAGVVVVALMTTNFIIPAMLETTPPLRVTAVSKPEPIEAQAVPEPVRVLSAAEATARAARMRAHADRVLAENGELAGPDASTHSAPDLQNGSDPTIATGTLKCVAGCD
jgi:hypothetical protein